ncbi:phosphonate transporter [Variovorax sp. N23]|uniref:phosphonate transporter n=1 Tax=Variovorax sp. N23 TaxID=2980555 RepID=UPI002915E9D1|nr:phosphonate transporter [Variovorax sp. N23]
MIEFDAAPADVSAFLGRASAVDLDALEFGVIGFDAEGVVQRYNAHESQLAGLSLDRVVGYSLFTVVAPCMNNFMVAQRFEDTAQAGGTLDETIDYVLTLRMRPLKVKLRLLAEPAIPLRHLFVQRHR